MCYLSYKLTTNYLRLLKFSSHLSKNTVYSTLIPKDSLNTLRRTAILSRERKYPKQEWSLCGSEGWSENNSFVGCSIWANLLFTNSCKNVTSLTCWIFNSSTKLLKSKKITLLSCFYKASLMFKVSEFSTILFTQGT